MFGGGFPFDEAASAALFKWSLFWRRVFDLGDGLVGRAGDGAIAARGGKEGGDGAGRSEPKEGGDFHTHESSGDGWVRFGMISCQVGLCATGRWLWGSLGM